MKNNFANPYEETLKLMEEFSQAKYIETKKQRDEYKEQAEDQQVRAFTYKLLFGISLGFNIGWWFVG